MEKTIKVRGHIRRTRKKGWRGDSLRHSFAARGIEKPQNMTFNSLEEIILADLQKAQRPMTAREISQRTNIAWDTVMKYLKELEMSKKVRSVKISETRVCWEYC